MVEEFSVLEKKVQRLLEEYMLLKEKDDDYLKLLQEKEAELGLFIEEQEALKKENDSLKKLIKDANEREEHVKAKLYSVSKILDSFDLSSLPRKDKMEEEPILQNNKPHVVETEKVIQAQAIPEQKMKIVPSIEEEKVIPVQTVVAEQKMEITPSTEEDLIDLNNRREDPFSVANDKDWDISIEEGEIPKESNNKNNDEYMPELTEESNNDEYMLDTEDDEFHFGLENEKL